MKNYYLLWNLRATFWTLMTHVDSLSLPKINAITTIMQTLHVNRLHLNPFNVKARHVSLLHANSNPSVQWCDHTLHRPNSQRPNNQASAPNRQHNNNNDHRTGTQPPRIFPQQTYGTRPPFRPISTSNTNQRRPPNNTPATRQNSSTNNAANIVCNNCGRLGHYANQCINVNRSHNNQNNRGRPPHRNSNNENAAPRNQHAYFITNSTPSQSKSFHHQAYNTSCDYQNTCNYPQTTPSWPDTNAPQMEINRALLNNDFLPTAPQAPPNTGSTELFPDDPLWTHQRFGPPILDNWLPDSGATCHYTPVLSDLCDVEACHIPVSLADGTTKTSTFKGTTDCYFTTNEGQKSIFGLTDVYYIEGLSHRLLSLNSKFHCHHQEQCHHNPLSQPIKIYMAPTSAWTPKTTSLFHKSQSWECYT